MPRFDKVLTAASFLILIALGIYFRTYEIHIGKIGPSDFQIEQSEMRVHQALKLEILKRLVREMPWLAPEELERVAAERVDWIKEKEPKNYAAAKQKILDSLSRPWGIDASRAYLHEADPYYYYGLTQRIEKEGGLSNQYRAGKFFHPLRYAPDGVWSPITFHPYLGSLWFRLLRILNSKIEMMEALSSFPLLLFILSVVCFKMLARFFNLHPAAIFLGSLCFVCAPIYLSRSKFGWYDTDCYNLIFPSIVILFYLRGIQSKQKFTGRNAVICGLATALYSFFWSGWPLLFFLILGLSFSLFVIKRSIKTVDVKNPGRFLLFYVVTVSLLLIGVTTPQGILDSVRAAYNALVHYITAETAPWPNIFITVGEAGGISTKQLIQSLGSPIAALIAFLGWALYGWSSFRRSENHAWTHWMSMTMIAGVLFFLSLKTMRFSLLFVLPFSLFVAWGVHEIFLLIKKIKIPTRFAPAAALALLFILIVPGSYAAALEQAHLSTRIMNDAWFETLEAIKAGTPENSVVVSAWPPGHFITSIAERKVFVDGGSQHLPEEYWSSRFFMSQDESEALGILRMLNAGGNDATDFLIKKGTALPDAIDMINRYLKLPTEAIRSELTGRFDDAFAADFLRRFRPDQAPPPNYIFIYDEMMEKNVAMSIMAYWNFHRASDEPKKHQANILDRLFLGKEGLVRSTISLSEKILQDIPAGKQTKIEGSVLHFDNGILVNLETMEALYQIPDSELAARPYSFFYVLEGKLQEKEGEGNRMKLSILYWNEGDQAYAVLAHPELIRSMLYRFYYLKGHTLNHFKPFFRKQDAVSGSWFYVFEVTWP